MTTTDQNKLILREAMTNLDSIKKQRHPFAHKGLYRQSYGFSSSHIQMWELDHKEGWAPKNLCFWTARLQNTLESPLDCKEIQPVNFRGNQPWIFIGRTDAEAEAPILWPPDVKDWLTGKDPDAGKDWRQKEQGVTGDEMVGWYHQLNGHGSEENPGDRDCLLQFTGSQRVGHILTSKQQSQTENEKYLWHPLYVESKKGVQKKHKEVKRGCKWTYLQNRSTVRDVESKLWLLGAKKEAG